MAGSAVPVLTIVIPALPRKGESRGRFGTKANRMEQAKFLGSSLRWNDERDAILVVSLIAMRQYRTRLPWVGMRHFCGVE